MISYIEGGISNEREWELLGFLEIPVENDKG